MQFTSSRNGIDQDPTLSNSPVTKNIYYWSHKPVPWRQTHARTHAHTRTHTQFLNVTIIRRSRDALFPQGNFVYTKCLCNPDCTTSFLSDVCTRLVFILHFLSTRCHAPFKCIYLSMAELFTKVSPILLQSVHNRNQMNNFNYSCCSFDFYGVPIAEPDWNQADSLSSSHFGIMEGNFLPMSLVYPNLIHYPSFANYCHS